MPLVRRYIQYNNYRTIRKTKEGGIIVYNNNRVFVLAAELELSKEVNKILRDLAYLYKAKAS